MKLVHAAGVSLLLFTAACIHEDTGAGGVWGRTVEPRLTTTSSWHACRRVLRPGHVVVDAQCAAAPITAGNCDDVIDTRDEADRVLVSQPQCTNAAIAALENFSRVDPAAMSDLAGAYYVRAQRNDAPADLLRAFAAAQRAVAMTPLPPGAQFNLALILEALSLNRDAIAAWQRAAAVEGGAWADEARAHRAALLRASAEDGEHQWPRVRARIDAALDAHDPGPVRSLIAVFPAKSESDFEERVLAQWAASPSPAQTARVTTYAEALSRFFNDRYFADVAATIAAPHSPAALSALIRGHLVFAQARTAEASLGPRTAAPLYNNAALLLRQGGSPQYLLARIAFIGQNAFVTGDYDGAFRELDALAADAGSRHYSSVIARVELNRLYADQFLSRYTDLFAEYEAAMAAYGRIGDWEDAAAADARTISAMSVVGLKESAWREALSEIRSSPRISNWKTRHLLIGDTATAALDLGYPEVALRYQNALVRIAPPQHLPIALRVRAAIELRLERYGDAQRDLNAAARAGGEEDASVRQELDARLAEVQGETALHVDPNRAVLAFTHAIALASSKAEFATFRALLFAERARALRLVGRRAEGESDMREALRQLHEEEERQMRERQPGRTEDLWNAYFSRFEETYDLLIGQLIEEGRADEAFRYAERARAFEPLDLVRRLPTAPAAFRELTADPDHLDIARLRELLPAGTFLIEYRVLDDQTYAWIVGRDVFAVQRLTARRRDVNRWTSVLQEAARVRDRNAFEGGLYAPYESLLKAPVDFVNRASGGGAANIVIIPDRELRGLPFAALRDPETKRYFIEDHPLSISGSALLYVFALLRDRDLASPNPSALLVGDPAFDPHFTMAQGLQRLAGARREVADIQAIYPRSDVLTGDAATVPRFLHLANGHAVVHIAAHAIVNGDAPSQSFLLFKPSGAEHGVLDAATLLNELHTSTTRLVVLSACSSAGGLPVGAEGIAPLVRPIIGAGVPGVVGALWDIDDATADALLVSFHRNYRRGEGAAEALRDAQLELLRSENLGLKSGLSWAPFEVIGCASSPFASVADITKEKPP